MDLLELRLQKKQLEAFEYLETYEYINIEMGVETNDPEVRINITDPAIFDAFNEFLNTVEHITAERIKELEDVSN